MESNTLMFLFFLGVGSVCCWGDDDNKYAPTNYPNDNTDNGYYQPSQQSEQYYNGGEQQSSTYQEQQSYGQQDAGGNDYNQQSLTTGPAYYNGEQYSQTYQEQPNNGQQDTGSNEYNQQSQTPGPAYDNGEQSSQTYQEQPNNGQQDTGNKEGNHPTVDISHFNIGLVLGGPVDFDGDNTDIDDFDFDLDELDRETEIDINSNQITPVDWVPLLENYIEVLSKGKSNAKSKYKIRKANELKNLEEELVRREKEDFEDEEPEKETCAKMEYNVLTHIHSLPTDQQKIVLDVDRDGNPDFDFVDLHDKLEFNDENN